MGFTFGVCGRLGFVLVWFGFLCGFGWVGVLGWVFVVSCCMGFVISAGDDSFITGCGLAVVLVVLIWVGCFWVLFWVVWFGILCLVICWFGVGELFGLGVCRCVLIG